MRVIGELVSLVRIGLSTTIGLELMKNVLLVSFLRQVVKRTGRGDRIFFVITTISFLRITKPPLGSPSEVKSKISSSAMLTTRSTR